MTRSTRTYRARAASAVAALMVLSGAGGAAGSSAAAKAIAGGTVAAPAGAWAAALRTGGAERVARQWAFAGLDELRRGLPAAQQRFSASAPAPQTPAAGSEGGAVTFAPAGDFNGDGSADVLVSPLLSSAEADASTLHFEALSGPDGASLWALDLAGDFGYALPVELGADAADGVLLLAASVEGTDSAATISFVALAVGPDGEERWRSSASGAVTATSSSFTAVGVPGAAGVLRRSDAGVDVMLTTSDQVFTAAGPGLSRLTVDVVDGATGAVRSSGEQTTEGGFMLVLGVGEHDGDGAQDYGFLNIGFDAPGSLAVHGADDGAQLWAVDDVPPGLVAVPVPLGDVDGDEVEDLGVGSPISFDDPSVAPPLKVLSGADGSEVLTYGGGGPRTVGDVTGDGLADVGGLAVELGMPSRIRVSAVTGAGEPVYDTVVEAGPSLSLSPRGGDVDADGVEDVVIPEASDFGGASFTVIEVGGGGGGISSGISSGSTSGGSAPPPTPGAVVSGATGQILWRGAAGLGIGGSLDGGGADLVALRRGSSGRHMLTARDGATGGFLWGRVLRFPEGEVSIDPVALSSDGAGDLIVNALALMTDAESGPDGDVSFNFTGCGAVLSGDDGAVLWSRPAGCVALAAAPPSPPAGRIVRVAGSARADTAAAISREAFPSADTVVLARSDVYADALAGAPLAQHLGAPILYTDRDSVPTATAEEIVRLGATTAVLLGGPGAISAAVADELAARGIGVDRIAGINRYETAAFIAERQPGATAAVLAEGANADPARGWPDALSAAPLAAHLGHPILLVDRDRLPPESGAALRRLQITEGTVVGGAGAVSDAVVAELAGFGVSTTRLAGPDRYATSRAVHAASVEAGMTAEYPWVGTGRNWPDTLTAGPAVAATGATLLLVDGEGLDGSAATRDLLAELAPDIALLRVVGGTGAVSQATEQRLAELLGP